MATRGDGFPVGITLVLRVGSFRFVDLRAGYNLSYGDLFIFPSRMSIGAFRRCGARSADEIVAVHKRREKRGIEKPVETGGWGGGCVC